MIQLYKYHEWAAGGWPRRNAVVAIVLANNWGKIQTFSFQLLTKSVIVTMSVVEISGRWRCSWGPVAMSS